MRIMNTQAFLIMILESRGFLTVRFAEGDDVGSSGNNAWVAGAVLGPVAGLALVAILAVLFYRRRQKRLSNDSSSNNELDPKPQLHSDCISATGQPGNVRIQEASSTGAIHEVEGSNSWPGELKANEAPAKELSGENQNIETSDSQWK